jgi:hypothetical protein
MGCLNKTQSYLREHFYLILDMKRISYFWNHVNTRLKLSLYLIGVWRDYQKTSFVDTTTTHLSSYVQLNSLDVAAEQCAMGRERVVGVEIFCAVS